LEFNSNKILNISSPPNLKMTTDWEFTYQEEDFRHYLNRIFNKFQDKI
jgi:hypothetical protein